MKKQNGITLISLIITIIIMLILAGVSLSMVMGDGSMLEQANSAATKTKVAEVQEYIDLAVASNKMAKYSKIGLKSKDALAAEMVEQGLITEEEKGKILANEELKINDVVINYGDIEITYNDAINAGVTEDSALKLSGKWTFNETLIMDKGYTLEQTINFTSNEPTVEEPLRYAAIRLWSSSLPTPEDPENYEYIVEYYELLDVYQGYDSKYEDGWLYEPKRHIDFGSTPQEVSQEFYDWFTANATKN